MNRELLHTFLGQYRNDPTVGIFRVSCALEVRIMLYLHLTRKIIRDGGITYSGLSKAGA